MTPVQEFKVTHCMHTERNISIASVVYSSDLALESLSCALLIMAGPAYYVQPFYLMQLKRGSLQHNRHIRCRLMLFLNPTVNLGVWAAPGISATMLVFCIHTLPQTTNIFWCTTNWGTFHGASGADRWCPTEKWLGLVTEADLFKGVCGAEDEHPSCGPLLSSPCQWWTLGSASLINDSHWSCLPCLSHHSCLARMLEWNHDGSHNSSYQLCWSTFFLFDCCITIPLGRQLAAPQLCCCQLPQNRYNTGLFCSDLTPVTIADTVPSWIV